MEHVEGHEANCRGFREAPRQWRKGRPEGVCKILPESFRSDGAKPDHRQPDEEDGRQCAACQHCPRHVARWITGLANMACGSLEGRRAESYQVKAGHQRCQIAKPPREGRSQVKIGGPMPVDL